jgi:hypothetical protein
MPVNKQVVASAKAGRQWDSFIGALLGDLGLSMIEAGAC